MTSGWRIGQCPYIFQRLSSVYYQEVIPGRCKVQKKPSIIQYHPDPEKNIPDGLNSPRKANNTQCVVDVLKAAKSRER